MQTLQPLLNAPDCDELAEWVRQQPLAHRATVQTEPRVSSIFLMVHAGIAPEWSFAQAMGYAQEIETALRSVDFATT